MEQILFSEYLPYFKTKFEGIVTALYTAELITKDYDLEFFDRVGEVQFDTEVSYTTDEETLKPAVIKVLILNNGSLSDPTISIETYLQSIKFEIITDEENLDDLTAIMDSFVNTYKSYTEAVGANTFALAIKDGAEYLRLQIQGTKQVEAIFNLSIIIFTNVMFSNDIILYINGLVVPNTLVTINRTTELNPDLKKTTDVKFYPNTSILSLTVRGIYSTDNVSIEEIVEDCATSSNFNQLFAVILYKDKLLTTTIINDSFFIKDSNVQFSYGSLASFEVTFYKGVLL